ncbi:MAG: hypothetical protein V2I33_26175, partial [Kangiellaceae bacterium]|nr:hypothetical protein [Kangiellaceae bacterium]
SVREFLRSIAENHSLNFSIQNDVEGKVANNFTNARVADVVYFICREYNLKITFYGSIFSFYKAKKPEPEKLHPYVSYNELSHFLSLDLKNDSLGEVVASVTSSTGVNLLVHPSLVNKRVSAYIKNRPFENALSLMAEANNLELQKKSERVYFLNPFSREETGVQLKEEENPTIAKVAKPVEVQELSVNEDGLISVRVKDASINDLLHDAALKTDHRYFLYSPIQGKLSTYIEGVNFDEFLDYIFSGTSYASILDEGIYFIGKRDQELLRTTELVKLEHRTIETVLDFIPENMKQGVDIKEFVELNGLVLSGSRPNINEIKRFLASIDQVVPVIKIDVLIVDVTKNATISAGIDLSFGGDNAPSGSSGKLNPGLEVTAGSSSINSLIESFNGLGVVNLGKVSSDFFANIKALEANGVLKLRSTPMLATLNGHEAQLTIG